LIDTGTIPNRLYTIGLDDLSSAIGPFNIRANVVDDICTESASIRLEGGPFPNRCESNLPFTAFGDPSLMDLEDSVANYCNRARNIPPGIYTIKATPSAGPACSHESEGDELAGNHYRAPRLC
jgi:hypothetical protein